MAKPLYTTTSTFTLEEYTKMVKASFSRLYHIDLLYDIVAVVFAIMAVSSFQRNNVIVGVLNLAVAALAIYLVRSDFMAKRVARKGFESNSSLQNVESTYTFYPETFEGSSTMGTSSMRYDQLHAILETETNFYLMSKKDAGIIVVKANCSKQCITFLEGLIQKYSKKK